MSQNLTAHLVQARARHAPARWLVVAVGLALGVALPVAGQAISQVSAAAALDRGVAALPVGERSVIASYTGTVDPAAAHRVGPAVEEGLRLLGSGHVVREVLFKEMVDPFGGAFRLAAIDDLRGSARLLQGRWPRRCVPTHCEVIVLISNQASNPTPNNASVPSLGVVVVGRASRIDQVLLAGTFDPGPTAPLLVADGVEPLAGLPALGTFERAYGWASPLDLRRVRALGVDGWLNTGAQVADALGRTAADLVLTTPDDVLRGADDRARISTQRFTLLGGATAALLLGTAILGGAAVRRDHEAFGAALLRRGATRRRLRTVLIGEASVTAGAGLGLGLLFGAAAAAVLAGRGGLDLVGVTRAALGSALPGCLLQTVLAVALLSLTIGLPAGSGGSTGSGGAAGSAAWHALEAVAAGAVAIAVLVSSRGEVTAASGAGAGGVDDPALAVLPAVVLLAAAALLARLWPALNRLAYRLIPRHAVAARLGIAAAGGRPLRPVVTAAVLTAALGAAVFAGSYRATLDRGALDQGAYVVPLDARLEPGPSLALPADVLTPAVLARDLPGARAFGVIRSVASQRIGPQQGEAVQLIGLDVDALAKIARWDAVTGGRHPPAEIARLLQPAASPGAESDCGPVASALPPGRRLSIATAGPRVVVAVTAYVRSCDGRERGVELAVSPDRHSLIADLPDLRDAADRAALLHLTALVARQPADEAARRQHALGEDSRDLATPKGRIEFGAVSVDGLSVDGAPAARPWSGWSGPGLQLDDVTGAARLDYSLTQGAVTIRRPAPGGAGPAPAGSSVVPVIVDPATAATAKAGVLTLQLDGLPVAARVVGTLDRFPTTTGRFALTTRSGLAWQLDAVSPGAGADELWLDGIDSLNGGASFAATDQRFAGLTVRERSQVTLALQTDPIARGASTLLLVGALIALLIGAAGLIVLVIADRTDEAAQAYAWEADGVGPAALRASLWWRVAAVAGPAVLAGVPAGVALGRLSATLVAVTATATTPQPPLVAGTGVAWAVASAVAVLVAALGLAWAVAWTSLREPLPVRPEGGVS